MEIVFGLSMQARMEAVWQAERITHEFRGLVPMSDDHGQALSAKIEAAILAVMAEELERRGVPRDP